MRWKRAASRISILQSTWSTHPSRLHSALLPLQIPSYVIHDRWLNFPYSCCTVYLISSAGARSYSVLSSFGRPKRFPFPITHYIFSQSTTPPGNRPLRNCNFPPCGYSTQSSRSLNAHYCSHTGERPFKCSHSGCGYTAKVARIEALQIPGLLLRKRLPIKSTKSLTTTPPSRRCNHQSA